MIRFECDYNETGHPKVIEKLVSTTKNQYPGYGTDFECENARKLILSACETDNADVHFFVGGTQTNFTVISSILRPYQGVICADCGHINVHETGSVEATGHKVIALKSENAKISASQIEKAYFNHYNDENHEHIVQPGMVYISNPTEDGTLYTKSELEEISSISHRLNLPLFLDGARLIYALASPKNDITLADYAKLCDVFYIGGTKAGLLFGEALVITNDSLKKDFRYMIKQKGAMLAKGWLLGAQFEALFEDGLYKQIGKNAIDSAIKIKTELEKLNIPFMIESFSNQQFPIVTNAVYEELSKDFAVEIWSLPDNDHKAIRIATSWNTKPEDADALINKFKELYK